MTLAIIYKVIFKLISQIVLIRGTQASNTHTVGGRERERVSKFKTANTHMRQSKRSRGLLLGFSGCPRRNIFRKIIYVIVNFTRGIPSLSFRVNWNWFMLSPTCLLSTNTWGDEFEAASSGSILKLRHFISRLIRVGFLLESFFLSRFFFLVFCLAIHIVHVFWMARTAAHHAHKFYNCVATTAARMWLVQQ